MCREKGAVRHDDRIDALAQAVKYYTDAMAISANQQMILQKQEDWNDMMDAWIDDPEAAASHMVLNMPLNLRKKARGLKDNKSVYTWV